MVWRRRHGLLRAVPATCYSSRHEVRIGHSEDLLGQRVVVGQELQRRGGGQCGGWLVMVVVVVSMVAVAEATTDGQLLSQKLYLIFDSL